MIIQCLYCNYITGRGDDSQRYYAAFEMLLLNIYLRLVNGKQTIMFLARVSQC